MNGDTIISTSNLSKQFKTITAVADLNLIVNRGDVFGFLGPNGAGKSTTIRMLLGLVKPTRGHISLFDRKLQDHRQFILSKIGALIEKPSFYKYLSARRNLEIHASLRDSHPENPDIDRVLDIVGLLHRADDKLKTYSQGMKQRLGIAQALLGSPELIILDEPTSGLDPEGMKEIRQLIAELSRQGLTIFLSSHLLHEVEQVCRQMAIINEGKLLVEGSVEELLMSKSEQVVLKIDRPQEAAGALKAKEWIQAVECNPEDLLVRIEHQQIPQMAAFLVGEGFQLFAIQPRKSLEDFYLSILESRSSQGQSI